MNINETKLKNVRTLAAMAARGTESLRELCNLIRGNYNADPAHMEVTVKFPKVLTEAEYDAWKKQREGKKYLDYGYEYPTEVLRMSIEGWANCQYSSVFSAEFADVELNPIPGEELSFQDIKIRKVTFEEIVAGRDFRDELSERVAYAAEKFVANEDRYKSELEAYLRVVLKRVLADAEPDVFEATLQKEMEASLLGCDVLSLSHVEYIEEFFYHN